LVENLHVKILFEPSSKRRRRLSNEFEKTAKAVGAQRRLPITTTFDELQIRPNQSRFPSNHFRHWQ
jgi:hypothetical protein